MSSAPPHKMNATEQAYHVIRNDILTGKLAEGERLTETRLSDDLGLSRTPIREAIGRLILEGFIERQSGYTTRVAHFPEDEAEQVYEIRRLVECYSVQRAARLATESDIAEAARSPRLTALMTTALDVSMVVRTYSMFSEKDLVRSLNHHAEIIDAIEARAPEWAASVMSAHLLAGAARVAERIAKSAPKKE